MAISYGGQATLSPDGRYWWDGTAWVPVATPPPGPQPGSLPSVGLAARAPAVASPAGRSTLSADGRYMWNGVSWIPVAAISASQPVWQAPPVAVAQRRAVAPPFGGWIALAGAAALVIGSFMPWASVNLGIVSVGRSGIDAGDGWIFVGGAAVIAPVV